VARHDLPITISIVDSADQLGRLVPIVEEMMDTGLIAVSDVQVIRLQKKAGASEAGDRTRSLEELVRTTEPRSGGDA